MDPKQALLIVVLVGFSLYRQTRRTEITAKSMYKLTTIYGIIGVIMVESDGWKPPIGIGWAFLAFGIVLSAVLGLIRGAITKVWIEPDGTKMQVGTWVTVSLFLLLIVVKTALGFWAGYHAVQTGASMGEMLIAIAIMSAIRSAVVVHRADTKACESATPAIRFAASAR